MARTILLPQPLQTTDSPNPRQSSSSSATSFYTAQNSLDSRPLTPSSRPSSFQVLGRQPLITDAHKVPHTSSQVHPGPPPPSPPASVSRDEDESAIPSMPPESKPNQIVVTFDDEPYSSPRRHTYAHPVVPLDRASSDTTGSAYASSSRPAHGESSSAEPPPDNRIAQSSDRYLQPPSVFPHRPARRNTTGSTPRIARPSKHGLRLSFEDDEIDGELASDIQLHAEQIRRERQERHSKRIKAQEAEAALIKPGDEHKPLVGNLIGEGHVNYVLMYNMLTGIRIGVRLKSTLFCEKEKKNLKPFTGLAMSGQDQTSVDGR